MTSSVYPQQHRQRARALFSGREYLTWLIADEALRRNPDTVLSEYGLALVTRAECDPVLCKLREQIRREMARCIEEQQDKYARLLIDKGLVR